MWPLAPVSILWLLVPLAIGLLAGWMAWRGRGSVFQVRRRRHARRTIYWRGGEPRMPDAPVATPRPGNAAATPATASDDDLTLIRDIGVSQAKRLRALGITRFAQIGAWSSAQVHYYGRRLGDAGERIVQERWPEQARLLAEGDLAGFAARFGMADSAAS